MGDNKAIDRARRAWRNDTIDRAQAKASGEIVCRRCNRIVTVSIAHFCSRRRADSVTKRFAECACRDLDATGRILMPGPAITADELQALGAELRMVSGALIEDEPTVSACACGKPSVALCDHVIEVPRGKTLAEARTCDAGMCADHRTKTGRNRDACPDHVPADRRSSRIKAIELVLPLDMTK